MRADFDRRLARREADPAAVMRWAVVKWLARPKVVSHRAAGSGVRAAGSEMGLRQVAVRFWTRQRVQVGRLRDEAAVSREAEQWGDADVVWQEPVVRDVRECMLMQRRLIKGVESEWEVWGFPEETSVGTLMGLSAEEDRERLRKARGEKGELAAGKTELSGGSPSVS